MIFCRPFLLLLLAILGSCQQGALVLHQQKIGASYLASTNVGSPDPRKVPSGQMIVAEWWLPRKVLELHPILRIDILFCNFTKTCVEFPIHTIIGYRTYSVLNEEFRKTKGLLAYRAQIVDCHGAVYATWKHQLFVELINIEETEDISSAVSLKSMQGSVIDTPLCSSFN